MYKLKLVIPVFLFFVFTISIFSGNDDNVKAVTEDLPDTMYEGGTVNFTVTITNNGDNDWDSSNLKTVLTGSFTITKTEKNDFKLSPGQSQILNYTITAPTAIGKKQINLNFYTDSKIIGGKSKRIVVISQLK